MLPALGGGERRPIREPDRPRIREMMSDGETVLMLNAFVTKLGPVAQQAGLEAMRFYGSPQSGWSADGSPVAKAATVILPILRALTPDIAVVVDDGTAATADL